MSDASNSYISERAGSADDGDSVLQTKNWMRVFTVLTLAACSSEHARGETPDDAAASGDAVAIANTNVVGSLGGQSFRLRYGAVKRGAAESEPLWVCAADVPVTFADCDSSTGPDRMMFLGPFIYDANGVPKWGLPQVWLYRVGSSPLSAWAKSGSLEVVRDDPEGGELQLMLNVNFGETTPTTGAVSAGN